MCIRDRSQYDVKIDIEEDGTVFIAAPGGTGAQEALAYVEAMMEKPEVGKIYKGKVVRVADFGAFVALDFADGDGSYREPRYLYAYKAGTANGEIWRYDITTGTWALLKNTGIPPYATRVLARRGVRLFFNYGWGLPIRTYDDSIFEGCVFMPDGFRIECGGVGGWGVEASPNGTVYAGLQAWGTLWRSGIYASGDDGDTWVRLFNVEGYLVSHFAVDHRNSYVYVAILSQCKRHKMHKYNRAFMLRFRDIPPYKLPKPDSGVAYFYFRYKLRAVSYTHLTLPTN